MNYVLNLEIINGVINILEQTFARGLTANCFAENFCIDFLCRDIGDCHI